jgi:pimeloyl-ACP methyl ester carboxylesterase
MSSILDDDDGPLAGSLSRRQFAAALTGGAVVAAGVAASARAQPKPPAPWTSEGFVQRPGGRLHYVSMGEGPPVVMLHKLGGWVADWSLIAPLLAPNYRVIAFDMPGHGESAMDRPAPYIMTLGESAAMIHAALDEMGVPRFALVGSSLGGCAGVVLAACYPEAVSHLALMSVALGGVATRADLAKGDEASKANYGPHDEPLPRTFEQVKSFGSIDPRINEEDNISRAKAGAWVKASEHGVGVAGVANFLPRVAAPTLLVYADRGTYTRYEAVGRAKLRDVTVAIIKDSGSFTYQEKPAEAAAVLKPFLARA